MCNATINQESLISQFELRTHHAPRTSQALPVLLARRKSRAYSFALRAGCWKKIIDMFPIRRKLKFGTVIVEAKLGIQFEFGVRS